MKRLYTYLFLLLAVTTSCENEPPELSGSVDSTVEDSYGRLGIAEDYEVSLTEVTRSVVTELGGCQNGDFSTSLSVGEWKNEMPMQTRISWNDGISWGGEQTSYVGIFTMLHRDDNELKDANGDYLSDENMLALMEQDKLKDPSGNIIGMNQKCTAYTEARSYKYLRYVTTAAEATADYNPYLRFDSESGECEGVDFYAYYPYNESSRDLSSVGGFSLANQANSIALILDDKSVSNLTALKFNVKVLQTDANLWYHDLMYSRRETVNVYNKYGNVGKINSGSLSSENSSHCDNVHLRMQHALCRLHVRISVNDIFITSHADAYGKVVPDYIWIDGTRVYHGGSLNLITGKITHENGGDINRLLDDSNPEHYLSFESPYIEFDMLFVPAELDDRGQFVFNFEIDGNIYSLDLFDCRHAEENSLIFNSGHVYNLNMEMSANTSVIINQAYGGHTVCTQNNPCSIASTGGDYGEWISTYEGKTYYATAYNYMIVYPQSGWRFGRVTYNGEDVSEHSTEDNPFYVGTVTRDGIECPVYRLVKKDNSKVTYSVRFIPEEWYSSPDNVLLHFDGYFNTGFSSAKRTKADKYWYDLTGSNTMMSLAIMGQTDVVNDFSQVAVAEERMNTVSQSGWTHGGFKCNGNTDYLAIEPLFDCREFTIEFYMCIESAQVSYYPRILGEADPGYYYSPSGTTVNASGIPSLVMSTDAGTSLGRPSYSTSRTVHLMGLGLNSANDTGSGDKAEITVPTDGNTLLHVVLRYKGGNGGVGADGLPLSHRDNLMALSLEYDSGGSRRSQLVYYTGSAAKATELLGGELSNWSMTRSYLAKWSLSSALDMMDRAIKGTIKAPYTIDADDYASAPQTVGSITSLVTYAQMHYLEDPYMPELWATLGGRANDFSRNLNATYCSFMVYDKFLTFSELEHNYNMNKVRFGTSKPDLAANSE